MITFSFSDKVINKVIPNSRIHYHYGRFEDLNMDDNEVTAYLMMFLPNVKYFATELKKAFTSGVVFPNDVSSDMDSVLADMCDEIIYIEDNF